MDPRLEHLLAKLKAFALTRPVAYGAPTVAMVGALAGLAMKTGPQEAPYTPEMEPVGAAYVSTAEPISWPAGKVPDYVLGTDFLEATQPPPVQMATYEPTLEPVYELPPAPDVPPHVQADHGPATPPPPVDAPQGASDWASDRGDILDVSLPEDRPQQQATTVLADAAATGMTTR